MKKLGFEAHILERKIILESNFKPLRAINLAVNHGLLRKYCMLLIIFIILLCTFRDES